MALNFFWVSFTLFFGFWVIAFCDQDGFLSLSCGGAKSFVDSYKIKWVSDDAFITTCNRTTVEYVEGTFSSSIPIRYFPDSRGRNCYRLPVENISYIVLVRAQFVYKNYDKHKKPPAFSVSLGRAIFSMVNLTDKDPWIDEFILAIRPLPRGAYQSRLEDFRNKSLRKCYCINSGYTNGSLRYPIDPFDRIWDADQSYTPLHASPAFNILLRFNLSSQKESPPLDVLQTARVLAREDVLYYNLPLDKLGDYYIVLYFAGILPVSASFDILINGDVLLSEFTVITSEASTLYFKQKGITSLDIALRSIIFYPQINALEVYEIVDIPPETSSTTVSALQVIEQSNGFDLRWQDDPCFPTPWDHIECEGSTVISLDLSNINLRSISPTFGDLLDLKTLNLHNTSLSGAIQNLGSLQHLEKLNLSFNQLTSFGSDLGSLVNLQVLDLHNNSLKGIVPDNLGELKNLHLLNLENNKLQGTLPLSLNRESLEVRTSGNLCLSFSTMVCNDVLSNPSIETPQVTIVTDRKHKRHRLLAITLGAAGLTLFALLLVSLLVLLYINKRKGEATYTASAAIDMRNWNAARIFSHKEIKAATKNFKEVIGRGSFGSVYLGKLSDGKLVAVKDELPFCSVMYLCLLYLKYAVRYDIWLLSNSNPRIGAVKVTSCSRDGMQVHLLSQIHHQNLVSLEGFCHESKQQILVYEYLQGGSLSDHLYGPESQKISLSWIRRLKITIDAAKGLDYLHNGSDPKIIHRDIKCSNILLDCQMNAKVCDFGLSKQVTQEDATHVTTFVKGTAGYIDPEYYSTQQLTEKSDIYSFGVVLLELICRREPLTHSGTPDSFNLVLWAKPYLQVGALQIVDDSLKGTFDVESMRKAALVTVRSVERDASRRPTIAEVLAKLKEAYVLQLSYLASLGHPVKGKSKVQRGRIAAFGYQKSSLASFYGHFFSSAVAVADASSINGGETMMENFGPVTEVEDSFPGKAWGAALYLELEKERAAAADESMEMILHLQEDKASIEMESTQYQRMIEKKSAYDEKEMNILKQILVGREKENRFWRKKLKLTGG
ncbi:putative LRR receptor-like serine/threonine-protein kinase [Hibiscus syriacus]|uniref:LRR receptor-like serine/threonine-protein kinase n=1 Tax=Hibiscus syriacus TaxID=106335 RepID=A0A6A2XLP7_HIBSY|nr:putative LRR receptor-like serine/threonine-protein kinase [Hibiscus syriacus]